MSATTRGSPDPMLVQRAVNTIRALTIDATQASGDGHPGMPMGAAPMGYALFARTMRHDPRKPDWANRDRYVQSAGHGSMLQYALLHLAGYDLPMDELRRYRQWGSRTPGHPEYGHTVGVETTTGPLGQGISTAVGMALAEAHLAARYNRPGFDVVDHHTFVIASDGDLMEGVSSEASSFAGHHGLGKLVVLYDDNDISIDGPTDITFSEDVAARYRAYGWHVQVVEDGNDVEALVRAIEMATDDAKRPSLVIVRTVIGYGAPNMAGTSKVHGSPLGAEEALATKRNLKIDWPEFTVPDDVFEHMRTAVLRGERASGAWQTNFEGYREAHPDLAAELERVWRGDLPDGYAEGLPSFAVGSSKATRKASHEAMNALAARMPELLGGSADLAGSNYTDIDGERPMRAGDLGGRIVHFGIREHAMAAIANGLSLHGGVRPFVATFLVFSDYLKPSLRLAALMEQGVVYVLTHDSIGLGGDGPTHQPVEHLMALRVVPNLVLLRPADPNETVQAWQLAVERRNGPTALALTRQNVAALAVPDGAVAKGGYVLAGEDDGRAPDVILVGTGSEVGLCLAARERLAEDGVRARVVSLPSFELFEAQDAAYRESVLPPSVRARVTVEAGATLGWERYAGEAGVILGFDRFGASAPGDELFERFGFTPERVAEAARSAIARAGSIAS
ncbi:MAG: transketolase [Trueperaceae bacterium]